MIQRKRTLIAFTRLSAILSLGLMCLAGRPSSAQSAGDFCYATGGSNGYFGFTVVHNYDANHDGVLDNLVYLWVYGRPTLRGSISSVEHPPLALNVMRADVISGPGTWGTRPVWIVTTVQLRSDGRAYTWFDVYAVTILGAPTTTRIFGTSQWLAAFTAVM